MFGEADAIVRLAQSLNNATIAAEFDSWRQLSQRATLDLWNNEINSFAVRSLSLQPGAPLDSQQFVQDSARCDLSVVRRLDQLVGVRELLAFVPW